MPLAMIGGILFPVTMFWFAWSGNFNAVHWVVPTLAGAFLCTAIVLIFVSYLNYLTDTYLLYAASAIAGNTVCRSALGAVAPLFTAQMFDVLGVGGAGSLIGGVACLLAPIPFLFYRYGRRIRNRSKFAPTEQDTSTTDRTDGGTQEGRSDSQNGCSSSEEKEQEAGTIGRDLEKELSGDSPICQSSEGKDPYIDADGLERAERT